MIITQTPFRMSFFGGGTDMESFFRENGGSVLSTTFDKYGTLAAYLLHNLYMHHRNLSMKIYSYSHKKIQQHKLLKVMPSLQLFSSLEYLSQFFFFKTIFGIYIFKSILYFCNLKLSNFQYFIFAI